MDDQTYDTTSRRERRKERTYRRLLEAAEQLFRTKGFEATTVEEIADAADVAKGTFFNYFENKASLLGAILYARIQPLFLSPPGQGKPAPERIRMLLDALWDELFPYHHIAHRMLAHIMSHPNPPPSPQDGILPSKVLARLIYEGQTQNIFRSDINADVIGGFIITYFFRIFILECNNNEIANTCGKDIVAHNLDLLYHGLMKQ